jgi:hypothetical protein
LKPSLKPTKEDYGRGQKIRIIDTGSMRNINQDFLIQRVQTDIYAGQYSRYKVKAASSLFGVTELIHRLLKRDESLFVDENATVRKIALFQERLAFTESYQITSPVTTDETLEMTESWATRTFEPPFTWGEFSTVSDGFWNLASWD